jgi:hypothetical protein
MGIAVIRLLGLAREGRAVPKLQRWGPLIPASLQMTEQAEIRGALPRKGGHLVGVKLGLKEHLKGLWGPARFLNQTNGSPS